MPPEAARPIPLADWRTKLEPVASLDGVRALARFLDNAVEVPGTKYRVGADAVIGLIPGVGDAVGTVISAYVILVAVRLGVPRTVLVRMLMNIGTDAAVGAVPFVGDVFDAAWKSNSRNVRLLERALAEPTRAKRASGWVIAGVLGGVFLIGVAGVALAVVLAGLLLRAIT